MAGRIRDEDLEEVKRRSNLVEVAAEYMQVKRAGGGRFKALCPFHTEKTPSFSIDSARQLYHCFGCQEGGDVITLVSKLENLSFVEAVERLARRAGVDLRYEQVSPADRAMHKRRMRMVEAHRLAAAMYHDLLKRSDEAADARTYLLQQRRFSKETLEAFSVGFSPRAWDTLVKHLRAKGFPDDEQVAAGLAMQREGGGLIDRFRGRVMFPIFDITGEPVAFGARRMGDQGPKYLNSAESPVYKKGQVLYALDRAKAGIVRESKALIVEGYTDVIALHQAGLPLAVATCGTALGLDHLKMLQRFTQQVVLSLDADEAGGTAAERTYEQMVGEAQQMGLSLKIVLMPQGDDPADTVNKQGPEAFRALVDGAVPLLEFVLKREADRYAVGDPEVRARALASGLRILAKTDNEVTRNEYARRLSDWIKVDPNVLHIELEKVMRTGTVPKATTDNVLKRSSGQVRLEKEAIKLALQFPPLVKPYLEDTEPDLFSVPSHREIWSALAEGVDVDLLPDRLTTAEARRTFTELAVQPPAGEATDRLAAELFTRLREFVLTRKIDDIKLRLQRINPIERADEHRAMFTELIDLEMRKRRLTEPLDED